MKSLSVLFLLIGMTILMPLTVTAQRYLTEYDSTLFIRDTVRPVVKRIENLYFSGYMQPQFQVAQSKGISGYEGGNFSEFSNSRFMLRRARVKIDYFFPSKKGSFPAALFAFQVDATERGVNVRDMYARIFEPKGQNFSLTMGLFARPFGYEVNLSSAYRETPERGRMSQILMPTERDLGAMISYEPQPIKGKRIPLKWDMALVNGQGLAAGGTTDFDSYKDLISRITLKPVKWGVLQVSGGLSLLNGGWQQATKYRYEMTKENGAAKFSVDSSLSNMGGKAERHYYGADVQVAYKHGWGKTEVRAEYWRGSQPGTAKTSTNPGVLPLDPTFIRPFDGAFLLFLQSLGNSKNELMVKYDWYDPNRKVKGAAIGVNGGNFNAADIRFNTLGTGLTHYFSDRVKFLVYYSFVKNENTSIAGFEQDLKDNVFTARFHFRF
jgi:hypothetical protein